MVVTTSIASGAGIVTGDGTFTTGESVSLVATPIAGNTFKQFLINGVTVVKSNPYNFEAASEDISIAAYFYTTIEDYLRGLVQFPITDTGLNSVRINRGVAYNADVAELSQQTLDLTLADILMWGTMSYTNFSGSKDSDGGWSHTEGSYTMSSDTAANMRIRANNIYRKYADSAYVANVQIVNVFGRPYYGC